MTTLTKTKAWECGYEDGAIVVREENDRRERDERALLTVGEVEDWFSPNEEDPLDIYVLSPASTLSGSRNQAVFVYRPDGVENGAKSYEVIHSQRFRILNGTWNPLMLANYAAQVGIQLEGLKRFEAHYKELLAQKAL